MRVYVIGFMFLGGCASGYAPGDYVPIMQSELTDQYKSDLSACYDSHRSFAGPRPDYRESFNMCLQDRGHQIDVKATNEKYERLEAVRKKKLIEKAKKSSGY